MSCFMPENLPYPFCPGCSHGTVLDNLGAALSKLGCDPRKVVIVTDIGCVGMADKYFATNTFHGLHGRSATYATGLKLANPELKAIVLIGDGGCGIGGHHLLNAARRNVGITVIVFNNFNFGMTGGEHSVTTPQDFFTSTTIEGNIEAPSDVCRTVAANGAPFVARATAFDADLTDLLAEAISYDGFALVDVWELCTAYFATSNKIGRKTLMETMARLGMDHGVQRRDGRTEYTKAYRGLAAADDSKAVKLSKNEGLPTLYPNNLSKRTRIVIAGSAGQKIRTAATLFASAAIMSGLNVTQRDEYPVTVMTGHSVAELVLDREKIDYVAIEVPDALVVLSEDGLKSSKKTISALGPDGVLLIDSSLPAQVTRAQVLALPFAEVSARVGRKALASVALGSLIEKTRLFPVKALLEAFSHLQKTDVASANIKGAEAGVNLIKRPPSPGSQQE